MQIRISVETLGTFEIERDKLPELSNWLSKNASARTSQSSQIREVSDNKYTGRELLEG